MIDTNRKYKLWWNHDVEIYSIILIVSHENFGQIFFLCTVINFANLIFEHNQLNMF